MDLPPARSGVREHRGLTGHVILGRRLELPRFTHVITIGPRNHEHRFRLRSAADLDEELQAVLCEAQAVGEQDHLGRRD